MSTERKGLQALLEEAVERRGEFPADWLERATADVIAFGEGWDEVDCYRCSPENNPEPEGGDADGKRGRDYRPASPDVAHPRDADGVSGDDVLSQEAFDNLLDDAMGAAFQSLSDQFQRREKVCDAYTALRRELRKASFDTAELKVQRERAEAAEAECERLRSELLSVGE